MTARSRAGGFMRASREKKNEYSYGDYLLWPDNRRYEIIEGTVYDMTPAPTPEHQRLLGKLHLKIAGFLKGKECEVFVAPLDVLLPEADEADEKVKTVVQPDLLVVCDPTKITPRGCRGAPDWIIEVLSPSTASKDQILKRRIYEKAGVREYWVIHPTDRTIMIYRLHRAKLAFVDTYDDQAELKAACLPGLIVAAAEIFPPQPKVVREDPMHYV